MTKKHWYDVTVTESYHHRYKVLAENQEEADDLVNDMVNCGDIDPTEDGADTYDRDVDVDGASKPHDGEEYWSRGHGGEDGTACNHVWYDKKGKKPAAKKKGRK